ncbi:hypothetical protein ACLKA6_002015 [Drosophila palustris]
MEQSVEASAYSGPGLHPQPLSTKSDRYSLQRATGRRACTTQQHSLAEQDSSRSSSLSRGNRSRSSSIGNMSNQNNAELAPYSRNVARRGHPFAVGLESS